ncbi:hypothetical protein HYV82_02925 [Candidatus Woesearchaeota archaeon]|nr:hypothetical protein [Candidatus Woesearchaeota archaeon]
MDAIDKILGDIHYESSGLTARLVVQHDIDGMGNHHGTGTLEIVVEKDGRLEYVGAIAAFESPASKPTMPTMIGRERKPFSSLPSTNADLIVYFSEANLPAEPAKTAAACLAVRNVYD